MMGKKTQDVHKPARPVCPAVRLRAAGWSELWSPAGLPAGR